MAVVFLTAFLAGAFSTAFWLPAWPMLFWRFSWRWFGCRFSRGFLAAGLAADLAGAFFTAVFLAAAFLAGALAAVFFTAFLRGFFRYRFGGGFFGCCFFFAPAAGLRGFCGLFGRCLLWRFSLLRFSWFCFSHSVYLIKRRHTPSYDARGAPRTQDSRLSSHKLYGASKMKVSFLFNRLNTSEKLAK